VVIDQFTHQKTSGSTKISPLHTAISLAPPGLTIKPNPLFAGTAIGLKGIGAGKQVSFKVFSLAGVKVWQGALQSTISNGYSIFWKGQTFAGTPASPGNYIIQAKTSTRTWETLGTRGQ